MPETPYLNIHVVRHGQTDWNLQRKIQGQTDIPLNELGLEQAHDLATKTDGIHYDLILSSDLLRAFQTAQILTRNSGLPVITDPRLREINMGKFEGSVWADIVKLHAPHAMVNSPEELRGFVGESLVQVSQRVSGLLNEYAIKASGKLALIVTHGLTAGIIHCLNQNLDLLTAYEHVPDNCEIRRYRWEIID